MYQKNCPAQQVFSTIFNRRSSHRCAAPLSVARGTSGIGTRRHYAFAVWGSFSRSAASGSVSWYQSTWRDQRWQARHTVCSQFLPQRGQTPQVSNVFQTCRHDVPHIQRSCGRGTHLHFGQKILTSLTSRLLNRSVILPPGLHRQRSTNPTDSTRLMSPEPILVRK